MSAMLSQPTLRIVCLDLTTPLPRAIPLPVGHSAVGLGNFDGVHVAHSALLREVVHRKEASPLLHHAGVFCFWKPSSDYFSDAVQHLTPLREKIRLFREAGLDFACFCDFQSIRHVSKQDFLKLLDDTLSCRLAVCGFNYRFGNGGSGTADDLTDYFAAHLGAVVIPAVEQNGIPVSSSRIRALLLDGHPDVAAEMLGRPYAVETTVRRGKQLGRTWGFPTINQYFLPDALVPRHGVYAVRCHTPHGCFPGVANVGVHPTVDNEARLNCETYILGLDADLYDQRIRTEFLKFVRPEKKFESPEQLRSAIRSDVEWVARYAANHPIFQ